MLPSRPQFYKVMKESFESVCNRTVAGVTVAEALANYADAVMLRSDRMSEAELDAALEGCVSMVGYVTDKDVFAEFCRKRMARCVPRGRAVPASPAIEPCRPAQAPAGRPRRRRGPQPHPAGQVEAPERRAVHGAHGGHAHGHGHWPRGARAAPPGARERGAA